MRLTLVGTGIALPHVEEVALRYNLAIAHLHAHVQGLETPLGPVEVERLDLQLDLDRPFFDDAVVEQVLVTQPEVLGLSCYSWDLEAQMDLAARVRERAPRVRIIAGGPSASFDEIALMEANPALDAVVRGEGERKLAALLQAGEDLTGVAGVTWRDDTGTLHTEKDGVAIEDLSELKSPLLEGVLEPPLQNLMLEFSRGCVYHCAYCAWRIQGKGVRYVSPQRIGDEVRWARERGYQHAFIIDSAVNNHDDRLASMVGAITEADPDRSMAFSYFANHAFVTEAQVEHLKALRPHEITIGLESVNPEAARTNGRYPVDRDDFAKALGLLSQVGPITISLMLGMPGDDLDGFCSTLDFVAELAERPEGQRIRNARVHWMLVAPASNLWKKAKILGIELPERGIPYVLGTRTFPQEDLVRALEVLHQHRRADLFVWEDADPVKLFSVPVPEMLAQGGEHLGGRAPRSLDDSEVLAAISPLEPGRKLQRGWKIAPLEHHNGWPVVVAEGPDRVRARLQVRPREAEPNPYARTASYDLIWLPGDSASGDGEAPSSAQSEEGSMIRALARLIGQNDG